MSFLVPCPYCGPRSANEFRFGGEFQTRPTPDASNDAWVDYLYLRTNPPGPQREWWYHRMGCRSWFLISRDLRTNEVLEASPPGIAPA